MTTKKFYPVIDRVPFEQRVALGLESKDAMGQLPSFPVHRNVHAVRTGEKRAPRKGEWYLSGAIPGAYMAPNDLSMEFYIVKLVRTRTETVTTIYEATDDDGRSDSGEEISRRVSGYGPSGVE